MNAFKLFQAWAEKNNAQFDYADSYGERGYSDPEKGIVIANWNDIPECLATYLERQGYELEWCDEWTTLYDACKSLAYRTQSDSWFWESQLILGDGEYYAPDGAAEWIEACKVEYADEIKCVPSFVHADDLSAEGWRPANPELECGWFPGQTDDPQAVVRKLLDTHAEVFLQRTEQSQFYTKYVPWVKADLGSAEL